MRWRRRQHRKVLDLRIDIIIIIIIMAHESDAIATKGNERELLFTPPSGL